MSKKFKVWLDSGANAFSCRKQEISLEELGMTDESWDRLSEDDKEDLMKEVAWDRMDWGYAEIEDET